MHKISKDIKKWKLDKSKYSKADLEVIEITNFPLSMGYRDCAQKRTRRLQINGGFVDKQVIELSDIKYVVTSKNIANYDIQRHTATSPEGKKFLEGILKAKSNKFTYIDGNYIEDELNALLERFSEPKPTPSMTPAKPKKAKRKAVKKTGLTDIQKEMARDKFTSGEMDIKELAKELKVTQTVLKPFLKSLNA
jgi:hypothetical protein